MNEQFAQAIQWASQVVYGDKVWPEFQKRLLGGDPADSIEQALRFALGAIEGRAEKEGRQLPPQVLGAIARALSEQIVALLDAAGVQVPPQTIRQTVQRTLTEYAQRKEQGAQVRAQQPPQGLQPPQGPRGLIGGAMGGA